MPPRSGAWRTYFSAFSSVFCEYGSGSLARRSHELTEPADVERVPWRQDSAGKAPGPPIACRIESPCIDPEQSSTKTVSVGGGSATPSSSNSGRNVTARYDSPVVPGVHLHARLVLLG